MSYLFIEAESFSDRGGWVIDSASMLQMGSAYLMAHGAGTPVTDASTVIDVEKEGTYFVYIRTRNWTAVWNKGTPDRKSVV